MKPNAPDVDMRTLRFGTDLMVHPLRLNETRPGDQLTLTVTVEVAGVFDDLVTANVVAYGRRD